MLSLLLGLLWCAVASCGLIVETGMDGTTVQVFMHKAQNTQKVARDQRFCPTSTEVSKKERQAIFECPADEVQVQRSVQRAFDLYSFLCHCLCIGQDFS